MSPCYHTSMTYLTWCPDNPAALLAEAVLAGFFLVAGQRAIRFVPAMSTVLHETSRPTGSWTLSEFTGGLDLGD